MQTKSENSTGQRNLQFSTLPSIGRISGQITHFWTEAQIRVGQITLSPAAAVVHNDHIVAENNHEEMASSPLCELPSEVLFFIFIILHPEALCNISQICRRFLDIARDEKIWEQKFRKNFASIPAPVDNFRMAFKNAYMQHNSTNLRIGVLFSLAAEGDSQQVIRLLDDKLQCLYSNLESLYDNQKNSFLVYLQRKQATAVLNHFFNKFYSTLKDTSDTSLRINKRTMPQWAITFHLSPDKLKELVNPNQNLSDKEFCKLLGVFENPDTLKTKILQYLDAFTFDITDGFLKTASAHLLSISLLHYSVQERHTEMVNFFILQGADVNSHSYYDGLLVTPLHIAVLNKDYKMAQLLIENGAKVDTSLISDYGISRTNVPTIPEEIYIGQSSTPLELALQLDEESIIQLLLTKLREKQLPISAETLAKGISKNLISPELLKLFIEVKAIFDGASCLWNAIKVGNIKLVQILLEGGLDPNVNLSINGHLPIHFAASLANHDCIKLLHHKGANLNALTYFGESALYIAKDNATRNLLRGLGCTGENESIIRSGVTLMWQSCEKATSKIVPVSESESEELTVRTWRI